MYLDQIQKVMRTLSDALTAAELTNQQIKKQEIAPGFVAETAAAAGLLLVQAGDITSEICARIRAVNPLLISLVETEAALKTLGIEEIKEIEDITELEVN